MMSTPLAANTSTALTSAGSASAWVSMPTNSGPVEPGFAAVVADRLRRRQDMVFVEGVFSDDPRWPEVPKATRWVGSDGSGFRREIGRHQLRHVDKGGGIDRFAGSGIGGSHMTSRNGWFAGLYVEAMAWAKLGITPPKQADMQSPLETFSVPMESERGSNFDLTRFPDANRSHPDQVRGRLSLENALVNAAVPRQFPVALREIRIDRGTAPAA